EFVSRARRRRDPRCLAVVSLLRGQRRQGRGRRAGLSPGRSRPLGLRSKDPELPDVGAMPETLTEAPPVVMSDHLRALEAESLHIMREVVAEFERPVMLYSIGKDSSVLLRLAQKAFYPGPIPFPLLHIDTTYKFREMIEFRDRYTAEIGARLVVHT